MLNLIGHNYIGGERRASGSIQHKSVDAITGESLPYVFVQATPEEVDAAAVSAAAAYPVYRNLSAARRAEFLEAIADEIDALGDDFISIVTKETALPAGRIQGERGRTSGQMRLFAKVLRRGNFTVRALIAPCQIVNCYHVRIFVSIRSVLAQLRYSVPAISRWRFLLEAAIPHQRWQPVAL